MNHVDRPDLEPPLAMTIVGGFLGAGKTTLINELLANPAGRRLAIVVNDFGAINVDAQAIAAVHDDVVSLTNGCICCTMRDGVARTILNLAERETRPDHVVIEASGLSEPGALAEVFLEFQRVGFVRVAGLVTLVDAEAYPLLQADAEPAVQALARAQVRQADLLVLTKLDLASPEGADAVRTQIRAVNPQARLLDRREVTPSILLGPLAHEDLKPGHHHDSTSHFQTAHIRIDTPVSFRTFLPKLTSLPPAIYRAKGWLNLLERAGDEIEVHVVGRRLHVRTVGKWADGSNGAARTELVFIGARDGWSAEALEATLRAGEPQSDASTSMP